MGFYNNFILVGALTQRSGTDLRAQIDKILNLVKNKDYPGKQKCLPLFFGNMIMGTSIEID